jgi:tetratricopeptide (TPR) repeat protein
VVAQVADTSPHREILVAGSVPALSEWFYRRPETGSGLRSRMLPGETVVLTDNEKAATAAHGGTGKTELAIEFAQGLLSERAADVLVWVTATSRDAILVGFAHAASMVSVGDQDDAAEAAAKRFVAWLSRTQRTWAIVLDDLCHPADLEGLWPKGQTGRVVITTRLPPAAFSPHAASDGAAAAGRGLQVVPVGAFSQREAVEYLSRRLSDYRDQRMGVLDLDVDLDGLPLGLAQAVAVSNVKGLSCREYCVQLSERRRQLAKVTVPGVSAPILATWSLAAECANRLAPAGMAWPALALAAMLDPNGIPGAVLASNAASAFMTGSQSTGATPDPGLVRDAVTNLARAGLVTIDSASEARTVRLHQSVQAAARAWIQPNDVERILLAAADALVEAWPAPGDSLKSGTGLGQPAQASTTALEVAFANCATYLCAAAGFPDNSARPARQGALWQPEAHQVLFRLGMSLEKNGLWDAAISYWQAMVASCARMLGPAHASSMVAMERLALAYESAGRFGDAIAAWRANLGELEHSRGPEHPDAIGARGQLAHAYASAGRPADAVALYEQVVADALSNLGAGHPVTTMARSGLAEAYEQAGRTKDSVAAYAKLVADSEQLLGTAHPATLAARADLADAYLANGQAGDAVRQLRRILGAQEAEHGHDHPDVIATRARLASALRRAGKLKEAIAQYERVLAGRERTVGADHQDTMAASANLAFAYRSSGQLREAIPLYERTLASRERVQGLDHADTRAARCNLAAAYQQAGRLPDAIRQYERALADSESMLGPSDEETVTTRASLAAALFAAGHMMEAIAHLEQALSDAERGLGTHHRITQAVRDSLATATKT